MSNKLKLFFYTLAPFLMLFFQWIIYVLVTHNISSSQSATRVLYLLLNCLSFVIQGLIMILCSQLDIENINAHMLISAIVAIILFLVIFNLLAVSYNFIPETIDDFILDYGYLGLIWAGSYTYNFLSDFKR